MEHDTHPRPMVRSSLHDRVALDEIDLYSEVLIAVACADHPLSPAEIDRVLGLSPGSSGDGPQDAAGTAGPASAPTGPAPRTRPDTGGAPGEDPLREGGCAAQGAGGARDVQGTAPAQRKGGAPSRSARPSPRGRVPEQGRPPEAPLSGPRFLPRQRPAPKPSPLPRSAPFTMRALPRLPLPPWTY
ncbi:MULTISPECIES: hypothetical protein [Nocardiopsidaceae]|uniref:Uncharacterized protein n=1 Tax=Streptomonospora nanhaiensis TaxID=1323731 RepID=A0ABY6YNI9_9ACTN|nr:hypothetical protein [Streptomonospora nanhaiensis]WAE73879.1 hypothetical protein OUQ99_01755 [Streptomonospora nanhaiensis]